MPTLRIAAIGDVHAWWSPADTRFFNESDYDALLITGDLARIVGGIPEARQLSGLRKPAVLVPGNHDASTIPQFLGELKNWPGLCALGAAGQPERARLFDEALGPVQMGGFSLHPIGTAELPVDCLVARPHSMGGDRLYFAPYLGQAFGVHSLTDSARLLRELVDVAGENLIFLAHNGPAGLGSERHSPWGCDFRPEGGDFGDSDLRDAVDYARSTGRRVLAVVAGHMHHHVKRSQKKRSWCVRQEEVLYVNAARVPRQFRKEGIRWHHHVALEIDTKQSRASEIWLNPATGELRSITPDGQS